MTCKRSAIALGGPLSSALLLIALITSCDALGLDSKLTPARDIVGTWTTTMPVLVSYQTDFCSDSRETVLQAYWHFQFIITEKPGDPNGINVEMRHTSGSSARVTSSCGNSSTGYVPFVSPQFMDGTVSSTSVSIGDDDMEFVGTFTTDHLRSTRSQMA